MIPKLPVGFSHPMRIGEGAFASVYRVRQSALERWVALKFIYEKDHLKRHELLKEAQTQARLHAECVPQIYDAFEWRQSVCMVMEWIRGISLESLLNASLPADDRRAIGEGLVRALAAIHAQGFAHRDLKPGNVIIAPDRGLFLVDFGFSKNIADKQVSSVTTAKGTPAYMAPELWSRGSQVDLMRTDIYAVGKMLVQILSETPHSRVTASLLHENPQQRPASGRELLAQWENEGLLLREHPDWKRIAGNPTSERLSNNLFVAAQQLLFARRSEEAYWLLVESLEENANNQKALELMSGFQHRARRQRTAMTYTLFGTVLLAGVLAAFFAGTRSRKIVVLQGIPASPQRSVKLMPASVDLVPATAHVLRIDSLRTDKLSGRLLVRHLPQGATIQIDAREVPVDSIGPRGLHLHQGKHIFTIRDSAGTIVKSETVRLLPFQTKVVNAARHPSASGEY